MITVSKVDQVIANAQAELGKPYVWGDEGPDTFDCSGLMQWIFGQVGISLPRTSEEQQAWANPVTDPLPGDLVFYGRPAHHVGLYIGAGKMVNAPYTGADVRVDEVGTPTSYGRVPGLGTAVAPLLGVAAGIGGTVTGAISGWLGSARTLVIQLAVGAAGLAIAGAGLYLLATRTSRKVIRDAV